MLKWAKLLKLSKLARVVAKLRNGCKGCLKCRECLVKPRETRMQGLPEGEHRASSTYRRGRCAWASVTAGTMQLLWAYRRDGLNCSTVRAGEHMRHRAHHAGRPQPCRAPSLLLLYRGLVCKGNAAPHPSPACRSASSAAARGVPAAWMTACRGQAQKQ